MNPRHYNRAWKVTAYRAKPLPPGGITKSLADFFEPLPNGIEITKLRVQFKVEKTLGKEPNSCEVVVTNLAAGTRAELCRNPLIVRVDAGYEDDGGARHLFTGDLKYGSSKQDNVDTTTTLQLSEGSRAFTEARVNRSYKAGASVITALREAAATMGLSLPKNIESSADLNRQFATGIALIGATRDELSRLLTPYGFGWSIQDGRLQVIREGEVRSDQAFLISQDTGMIDSPEFGAPDKKGKPPTLTIRSLLYPQVTPGVKLDVRSASVNGIFRAERVTHTGDSHGDDWTTEIEAKQAT